MLSYRQPFRGDYPITQNYGEIIPGITYGSQPHTGIDYECPTGTEILASGDGLVVFATWDPLGFGNCVIIQHNDGKSTLYGHLSQIKVVLRQKVQQGDVIGLSGTTGNSTGSHLHFEARRIWYDYKTHEDPVTYLPLMTYADSVVHTEPVNLKNAGEFDPGTMVVVAPAGAKAFDLKFESSNVFQPGTKVNYTGDSVQRNGYEYMRCFGTFYIAVNDHETQILDKVK